MSYFRKNSYLITAGFILVISMAGYVFAQGASFRDRVKDKIQNKNKILSNCNSDNIENSITVDGRERTYIVHLPPASKQTKPLPLVLVLHGGGGNAENAINMANMNGLADKEGFIVVYPNGSGRLKDKVLSWNDGSLKLYAAKENIDDVKFLKKLIEKLEIEYNINKKMIYSTGISNGGIMSYRLACELSDVIAAIGPVSASLCTGCKAPDEPVSVIIFNGTADEHIPYNGGYGKKSRAKINHKPVSSAVDFWVKADGCSETPKREEFGNIFKETYTGGEKGTEVVLYTIKGGGHSWPGGRDGLKYGNADPPTDEIDATKLIWDFFKNHTKPSN
jgi:polyhydroxybutyrate depolymerase